MIRALPPQRSPKTIPGLKMKSNFFRSLFKNMVVIGFKLPNNYQNAIQISAPRNGKDLKDKGYLNT